jgi:hypothetical protein
VYVHKRSEARDGERRRGEVGKGKAERGKREGRLKVRILAKIGELAMVLLR